MVKQHLIEAASESAPDLLEKLFASIGTLIVYMDVSFRIIRVNRAYAQYAKAKEETFVGRNFFEIQGSTEYENVFKRVAKTGEPVAVYEQPFSVLSSPENSSQTYWDWNVQPVKEPDGSISGLILSLLNATERRLTREALLAAESSRQQAISETKAARKEIERLAAAIEQAAECVLISDISGNIKYVNPAFEKVTGYSAKEINNKNIAVLEDVNDDTAPIHDRWATLAEGHQWKGRIRKKKKSGEIYHADVAITPLRDDSESDQIVEYVIVERDVTREDFLEKQLRRSHRMEALGTLAGGIAHDLNNILMPITLNTELVLEELDEEDPNRSLLDKTVIAAKRGRELVKQIVTFSRTQDIELRSVHLVPLFQEALGLVRSSLPPAVEIKEQIDVSTDIVRANPSQIHQIIMNLSSNAEHATRPHGGVLEIKLFDAHLDGAEEIFPDVDLSKYLRLVVQDTGCGMSEATMDKIFDPFFTTKPPGEGTGMGLAVVHGIVSNHKGIIDVHSVPNKGTRFDILLPKSDGLPLEDSLDDISIPRGREHILLVDDDIEVIDSVTIALKRLGYRVQVARNADEAQRILKENPRTFDLFITDQVMKDLCGTELIADVRKIQPDIPVILYTGHIGSVAKSVIRSNVIQEVLEKPVTVRELGFTVRRALDESRTKNM